MAKQRLYYLDALKGILIILVILGHSIQYKMMDYQHDVLFRVIYSFHMPLFFLISGFLTYKGRYDAFMVKKRFVQLLFHLSPGHFFYRFLNREYMILKGPLKY